MPKVLIIEDDPDMRANLCGVLELYHFQVVGVGTGEQGVEQAGTFQPDLILCDVVMHGMDGYAVLRTLRKNSSTANIPFIFLTGRGEKSELREGMNLGADDYLVKPVMSAELLAAIQARLKRERERTKVAQPAGFKPNFSSAEPLRALGLTPREAEVLLWLAQGKTNSEIGTILGTQEATVKKHLEHVFAKLGVEGRSAAMVRAFEVLSK